MGANSRRGRPGGKGGRGSAEEREPLYDPLSMSNRSMDVVAITESKTHTTAVHPILKKTKEAKKKMMMKGEIPGLKSP